MSQFTQSQPELAEGYPEGELLRKQSGARRQNGVIWRTLFLISLLIGIISLTALLYNIVNSAFGYVAVQNKIDPDAIMLDQEEAQLLAAPNLVSSEDDTVLAEGVLADPNAIGFFGYAYYQNHTDTLKTLSVDGVAPSAEALDSGNYPLARPLFIYTAAEILQSKPQVAAFANYYLTNVNRAVSEVGYFPTDAENIDAGLAALQTAAGDTTGADNNPGDITVAGSSTVYPLTQRIAADYRAAGYTGALAIDNVGTSAGFAQFCSGAEIDIVNASRAINRAEIDACRKVGREPLALRVGTDALVVVASQQNSFLQNVTTEQLRTIFTTAETWADVDPAWPAEPIKRFIPGADSGTLDFFVETVYDMDLQNLPKAALITLLEANVSAGLMRRFESEIPFAERTQEDVYELVLDRVIEREAVDTWTLSDSIFKRQEIEATVATIPNGELTFRSWVSMDFLVSPQSSNPERAGIRSAIFGSLWVILITLLIALPIGVGAAIYLEEYAKDNGLNRLIQTNINNLAGVPSIIYGMLGLALFVRLLEPLTSGALFGAVDPTTANGRTILSASLTLALLVLPLIIINAQEAIRAVPKSLREAGYGLGATQWQVIWAHVLPSALPGILTGNILAMSRAIGETAPLVVVGASTFVSIDPSGPFSKFTSLPVQIYQWASRPQDEFRNIAAAAIIVLMVMLLSLNAAAVLLRNQYGKRV